MHLTSIIANSFRWPGKRAYRLLWVLAANMEAHLVNADAEFRNHHCPVNSTRGLVVRPIGVPRRTRPSRNVSWDCGEQSRPANWRFF